MPLNTKLLSVKISFKKRLIKNVYQKESNLVLTFDRSVFLSFLCPLLPVAALGQVH